MALQPPSPQSSVPRADVAGVVDAMLMDERVRWIGIVFQKKVNDVDQFTITPYVIDPIE